jgi:hypothetical protein
VIERWNARCGRLLAFSNAPIAPADLQQFETTHCRLRSDSSAPEKLLAVVYPATATEAGARNIDETTVTLKEPLPTDFETEMRRRFRAYFALGLHSARTRAQTTARYGRRGSSRRGRILAVGGQATRSRDSHGGQCPGDDRTLPFRTSCCTRFAGQLT